ncbi:hypothetical protein [Nonomuraea sp. NPDC046570]|uniref:hypothetical protein n=1 Tax=Nonomuraea sp. NPDC046570 TaxID=3155255 RepID=UPI0033F5EC83
MDSFGGGYLRSVQLTRISAAESYLAMGELEGALVSARQALPVLKELTSTRAKGKILSFAKHLQLHRDTREVREFDAYLHAELAS